MDDSLFEWDAEKAAANFTHHGVAFEKAIKTFRDLFAIEWIDERENYGEERVNLLGVSDGILLHVTYTERSNRIRIISARRAVKHEQEEYYSQNSARR